MNRFTIGSAIAGFVLIVSGAAWIYHPLGPITAGALLIVSAFMSLRAGANKR